MADENYIAACKAMGDAQRIRILEMLAKEKLCGSQILEHFSFSQPTLSHHMKALTSCGLVTAVKEGVWVYYSLDYDFMQGWLDWLSKSFNIALEN